jgi:hypothetical protein
VEGHEAGDPGAHGVQAECSHSSNLTETTRN